MTHKPIRFTAYKYHVHLKPPRHNIQWNNSACQRWVACYNNFKRAVNKANEMSNAVVSEIKNNCFIDIYHAL